MRWLREKMCDWFGHDWVYNTHEERECQRCDRTEMLMYKRFGDPMEPSTKWVRIGTDKLDRWRW